MVRTALTALMVPRQMARTAVQLAVVAALAAMAAMAPTAAAGWGEAGGAAAGGAGGGMVERAALGATLLADRAGTAVTAATVGRLMAAARLVAMARRAVTAARRPAEMAASE